MNGHSILRTALVPVLAVAGIAAAAPSVAQQAYDNSRLPKLADVRPLPQAQAPGLFRNIQLSVELGYGNAKNVNQPTQLDQKSYQTLLGIQADIGDVLFAGVSGSFSHEDIRSTNLAFGMNMAGVANVLGVDGVVGVRPAPFLSLGVMGGLGSSGASYTFPDFPAFPATPGDGTTRRLGAFVNASYGIGQVLLTGSASLLNIGTDIQYGPGNIPQSDSFGATLLMAKLGAAYRFTDKLTVGAALTVNQVLSQVVASAQTGLDPNWLTVEAGAEYAFTSQFSVNAKASTWLLNDRMSYSRFAIGARYKF